MKCNQYFCKFIAESQNNLRKIFDRISRVGRIECSYSVYICQSHTSIDMGCKGYRDQETISVKYGEFNPKLALGNSTLS